MGGIVCVAFPDDNDAPAQAAEGFFIATIPGNVLSEFPGPEVNSGLGSVGVRAFKMSVPETSVHEDHGAMPRKHKIRAARQIFAMEAESEAQSMGDATDGDFWSGVSALDGGHHRTSPFGVHNVHCARWLSLGREALSCLANGGGGGDGPGWHLVRGLDGGGGSSKEGTPCRRTARVQWVFRRQFLQAARDPGPRHPGGPGHHGNTAMPQRFGVGGGPEAPRALVQQRRQSFVPRSQSLFGIHASRITPSRQKCSIYILLAALRSMSRI